MNVTKVEMKESTKHCCGNGWGLKDSAEHEGEGRALIDQRITENNSTNADRRGYGMLEEIVSADNLKRASDCLTNLLSDSLTYGSVGGRLTD